MYNQSIRASTKVGGKKDGCFKWLVNNVILPKKFGHKMMVTWFKHNVEEVGSFEQFLPTLYANRGKVLDAKSAAGNRRATVGQNGTTTLAKAFRPPDSKSNWSSPCDLSSIFRKNGSIMQHPATDWLSGPARGWRPSSRPPGSSSTLSPRRPRSLLPAGVPPLLVAFAGPRRDLAAGGRLPNPLPPS